MKRSYILLIISSILAVSCISKKECARRSKIDLMQFASNMKQEVRTEKVIEYKDTIIYTPQIILDTIFRADRDTVVIHKDKLTIKYIHTKDTVKLTGKCESDTITIEKVIYKEKQTVSNSGGYHFIDGNYPWWWLLIALITGVVVGGYFMTRQQ